MKTVKLLVTVLFILYEAVSPAAEISLSPRIGYSPAVGGSMSSGWQSENLNVPDGIYSINRSMDGFAVSGIQSPVAVIAGIDCCIIRNFIYYRAGIEYLYQISGGSGKTVNPAGTEIVNVKYSQWSLDAPLTAGVSLTFWGESRIFLGCGAAFAYGTYSNSFSSVTLNHSGTFTGYAIPLAAEAGCEYLLNEKFSVGCSILYLYGKSAVIDDGADYARIDFSGFHITATAALHFNI